MKRHTKRRRLGLCLISLLLAVSLLPAAVLARGLVDTDKKASLTLQYPCPEAEFQLYQVGLISETGTFSLTGDFADYAVSLDQPDFAHWRALAATLAAYAARDERRPLTVGKTDADGTLAFAGLTPGLYLVVGQRSTMDGFVYTPEPFLISLPGLDDADAWIYDVTARPKHSRDEEQLKVELKVLKVWEDGGNTDKRPASIEVELLKEGEVCETVTLNKDNNWRHTWTDLDGKCEWQVVEKKVPDGYKVTVSKEGITFTLTNKLPDTPDKPTPPGPNIPETGQFWWPVPILACGGMCLFLAGWLLKRKSEHDA